MTCSSRYCVASKVSLSTISTSGLTPFDNESNINSGKIHRLLQPGQGFAITPV